MSTKPKRGRPKKERREPKDKRTPGAGDPRAAFPLVAGKWGGGDWQTKLGDALGDLITGEIRKARAVAACFDYSDENPELVEILGPIIGGCIAGKPHKTASNRAANFLVKTVNASTADEAEKTFAAIIRMMRSNELRHRTAYALIAYDRYFEEVGREPSKPELREYICARRGIFREAPAPEDKKGWSRLWTECGLAGMADR